jgi:hypothetical protein
VLAAALAASSPAHAAHLTALIAAGLRDHAPVPARSALGAASGPPSARLMPLLPAVRVILEHHVAAASATTTTSTSAGTGGGGGGGGGGLAGWKTVPSVGTRAYRASDDLKVVSIAFHNVAAEYFSPSGMGLSAAAAAGAVAAVAGPLGAHAASILAAADAITPCGGRARDSLLVALLPPEGWCPSPAAVTKAALVEEDVQVNFNP